MPVNIYIVDQAFVQGPVVYATVTIIDDRIEEPINLGLHTGRARGCRIGAGRAGDQGIASGLQSLGGGQGVAATGRCDACFGPRHLGRTGSLRRACEGGQRQEQVKTRLNPHQCPGRCGAS